MPWTLAEAQKMTNDVLLKGIIQTIITQSDLLKKIPFKDIVGNGETYLRESTQPTAGFYSPNDVWTESTGTRTSATASLSILGGDTDLDEFERKVYSDQNDLEAILIEEKSKIIADTFDIECIYGSTSNNAKGFNGLHSLVDSAMALHSGATTVGLPLALSQFDQLIDLIKPGKPDIIVMNRTVRRRLGQYYRAQGAAFPTVRGKDGIPMEEVNGIPICIDDWITQTEAISGGAYSAKTGGVTTSVFAVRFGPKSFMGIQNGGIQKVKIGQLETKDAQRWRIKWYVSLALYSTLALARLDGITDAVVLAVPA